MRGTGARLSGYVMSISSLDSANEDSAPPGREDSVQQLRHARRPAGVREPAADLAADDARSWAPKTTNCVFDVGLHKGEDTEFYLAKGYRVVAFEADPDLVRECRARFAPQIAEGRLIIVEGAIAVPGTPPRITFYKNLRRSVWGTTDAERAGLNARLGAVSRAIEVDTVIFTEMFDRYGVPAFMKVDIEGADAVVRDALKAARTLPTYLSIESDKTSLDGVAEEIDLLAGLGYQRFMAVQQERIPNSVLETWTVDDQPLRFRFRKASSGPFGPDLPGPWLDRTQIMDRYRRIYREYARWGDDSLARRVLTGSIIDRVGKAIGHSLPGWYDTHARMD